jgi:hypothetical protein
MKHSIPHETCQPGADCSRRLRGAARQCNQAAFRIGHRTKRRGQWSIGKAYNRSFSTFMSTTPTAGQSGPQSESTGNGSHLHGCLAAQQSWSAQYRAGLWDDLDSAEQSAPYLTICELYQRHVGDGALLDIGCGSGMLYRYLTEHAGLQSACYTGVDVADDAVRCATASFPGVRISRRNYHSEAVGSRFDCVIFNESLQCFDDPEAVLDKCTRDNLHPCSVLIVAMSGWEHGALWQLLEHRYQLLDEQEARGDDGRTWTVRVYKVPC